MLLFLVLEQVSNLPDSMFLMGGQQSFLPWNVPFPAFTNSPSYKSPELVFPWFEMLKAEFQYYRRIKPQPTLSSLSTATSASSTIESAIDNSMKINAEKGPLYSESSKKSGEKVTVQEETNNEERIVTASARGTNNREGRGNHNKEDTNESRKGHKGSGKRLSSTTNLSSRDTTLGESHPNDPVPTIPPPPDKPSNDPPPSESSTTAWTVRSMPSKYTAWNDKIPKLASFGSYLTQRHIFFDLGKNTLWSQMISSPTR